MTESQNKQIQQAELTAKTDNACCHTLHHRDSKGQLLGTWAESAGVYGLRVYCKVCGKFYGYQPRDFGRTDDQCYRAYLKQREEKASIGSQENRSS